MTISAAAKAAGLSAKTIRFYEDEGLLPPPRRSESGYRLYADADLVRLRLVRRLKLLSLDLPSIKTLVKQALAADCARFGTALIDRIASQRAQVERQMAELRALSSELAGLEEHLRHCCEGCRPADQAAECGFCGLISDEEGGEQGGPE
jgi:DNA-binding transcriptional MerR regulator